MTPPRDNLLEAFQDVSGKKSPVGGPFSGGTGGAGSGGRPPAWGGLGALGRGPGARRLVVAVAALALAFVVGVAVGRATAGADAVDAAEREDGYALGALSDEELATAAPGWVDPPRAQEPAAALADDERALSDPRNKYTVVAFTATPSREQAAWESYDHLRAQGLPAFRPFAAPNGMITVVLGAAPKESDLADALSRVQRLTGPNGRGRPYETAYTTPIQKLTAAASGD